MYITIQKAREIRDAQKLLLGKLHESLPLARATFTIGYQGGNFDAEDLRSNGRVWFVHRVDRDSSVKRNWNAFGDASDLRPNGSNKIIVETNVALDGKSGLVAGLFVKDSESGNRLLIHSGKIGGGKKGIGKSAFLAWYKGRTIEYAPSSRDKTMLRGILVADLDSNLVVEQVENFVRAVRIFKQGEAEQETDGLSDDELRKRADKAAGKKPGAKATSGIAFDRDIYIAAYAKRRAKGKCELCKEPAPFESAGKPYLECHHIQWLAHGGYDSRENTVALCPNCHRKMHIVGDSKDIALLKKRAKGTR